MLIWLSNKVDDNGVGHILCMGQMRNVCHTLSDSLKGKYHLECLNIGGRMVVKVYFKGLGSECVDSIYLDHCVD
jgi:hypothetical protein